MRENRWCLFFWHWLDSFSVTFSSYIYFDANGIISLSLWLKTFFVCSSLMDNYIGSIAALSWVMFQNYFLIKSIYKKTLEKTKPRQTWHNKSNQTQSLYKSINFYKVLIVILKLLTFTLDHTLLLSNISLSTDLLCNITYLCKYVLHFFMLYVFNYGNVCYIYVTMWRCVVVLPFLSKVPVWSNKKLNSQLLDSNGTGDDDIERYVFRTDHLILGSNQCAIL